MKTTNKIQKTALTAAMVAGFSIFGLSIDAQEEVNQLLENNKADHYAMATVANSRHFINPAYETVSITAAGNFSVYLTKETEAPLNVEGWMMNDSRFTIASLIESETETPLEIESWMKDVNTFNANSLTIETAIDEQLEIEDWMIDEKTFEAANNKVEQKAAPLNGDYIFINNFSFPKVITDSDLQLEGWMMDPKVWDK
jgi:hypothetical protein